MSRLWDKLNDREWVPQFGEVIIKYQNGVPVIIQKMEQEKLDPEPQIQTGKRKLPTRNPTSGTADRDTVKTESRASHRPFTEFCKK